MTPATQTPEPVLTFVCSWHGDAAQRTAEAIARGERVTHGVCPECEPKMRASWGLPAKAKEGE